MLIKMSRNPFRGPKNILKMKVNLNQSMDVPDCFGEESSLEESFSSEEKGSLLFTISSMIRWISSSTDKTGREGDDEGKGRKGEIDEISENGDVE